MILRRTYTSNAKNVLKVVNGLASVKVVVLSYGSMGITITVARTRKSSR